MECRFYIGQKIVCVDAGNVSVLKEGATYTVRELFICPPGYHFFRPHRDAPVGVRLEEIPGRFTPEGIEMAYACTRFRPVTDISSLEALLRGAKLPSDLVEA